MLNAYDFQVDHPGEFTQLAAKDTLFLNFKFPQQERRAKLYTQYNKIFFVLDGKKVIHHRDQSWLLSNGESFLIKKAAYEQEIAYDFEWEVLCFYMPDEFLRKFVQEYRSQLASDHMRSPSSDMLLKIDVNEATRAFFYSIIPYFTQQPAPAEKLLELKFKELLLHLLTNPANRELLSYVYMLCENHRPPLREIMEANYTCNLSLSEFARMAQRSLAGFKREFILQFNTTPGKWLTGKRLEYARHLLQTSSKSIIDVAYECGFENGPHFSKVFKEKYGASPLQYRKQKSHSLIAWS